MKPKTLILKVAVAAILFLYSNSVTSDEMPEGLVLWNTLDNTLEVTESKHGEGFILVEDGGEVRFEPGVFGNAMGTTGGTANTGPAGGYLAMNPDQFFGQDKTKGTVEFWLRKDIQRFEPYRTPLLTFFGRTYYATGYLSIHAGWNDGSPNLINKAIFGGDWHFAQYNQWESIPVGEWVHLAFVWDGSGIDGSADDLRIYLNDEMVANHQGRFDEVPPRCCIGYACDSQNDYYCQQGGYEVRVMGNHAGYRLGYPSAFMDNLKVWAYAKTDFSDRFVEGFLLPPIADAGMDQAILLGEWAVLDGSNSYSPHDFLLTFEWDLGNGDVMSDPIFQYEYTEPGAYVVRLEVTDEMGRTDVDEIVITVQTPVQALQDLIPLMEVVDDQTAKSFVRQLEDVIELLEIDKTKVAKNRLQAFINHVQAQEGKSLEPDLALELIETSERVMMTL